MVIFDVSCYGASDASAIATGSGITFEWFDNNGTLVSTDQHTATILSAGQYTVTSTDVNGCEGTGSILITEPTLLSISVAESNPSSTYQVSCFGANDGWAEVTIMVELKIIMYLDMIFLGQIMWVYNYWRYYSL